MKTGAAPTVPTAHPECPSPGMRFRDNPIADTNLRVQKRFPLGGTRQALVSLEFFNLFSLDNVTLDQGFSTVANYCASSRDLSCGLDGRPSNPNFARTRGEDGGYLTGNIPGPPFQMQIGFRLLF